MTRQQRDAWYFDIMWSRIHDHDAKGPDINNFILGKKLETTARIGALAYGKVVDEYAQYLSAVLRARFDEIVRGVPVESEEVSKANYFAIIFKIIEEKISRHQDPDVLATIIDFLFNTPDADIVDVDTLGNWAFTEPDGVYQELLSLILKARFKELISRELKAPPVETKVEERQELSLHQQAYLMTTLKELLDRNQISVTLYSLLTKEGFETLRGVYNLHTSTLQYLDSDLIGEIASIFDRRHIPWSCVALLSAPAPDANLDFRYREEVKDCKIEDFANGSPQREVLSSDVLGLISAIGISSMTAEKLIAQGITTGLELYKTSPQWLMGYLLDQELEEIHQLFVWAKLHYVPINLSDAQKDFLRTLIDDLDLPVRLTGAIKAYNGGRPIKEQYLTAGDIYVTSVHDFLKLRNIGKKKVREISDLFVKHGFSWF